MEKTQQNNYNITDTKSNSTKIMDYLNKSSSRGYKRIIDLLDLASFVGVSKKIIISLCEELKDNKKIYFYKIRNSKAIMRIQPKFPDSGM
jgi:hypothetical protein